MAKYKQNARTAGRVIDGLAFVVTPHNNTLHTLNSTGTAVWTMAESGCTIESIAAMMTERYDVTPEQAIADAAKFCDELVARQILDRCEE
ncbi:MAG: PqqD family protein [Pseudomonadota bacterium]